VTIPEEPYRAKNFKRGKGCFSRWKRTIVGLTMGEKRHTSGRGGRAGSQAPRVGAEYTVKGNLVQEHCSDLGKK